MLSAMSATTSHPHDRPRTLAASRLPRPPHEFCAVALPLYVVPGALIVLDGDADPIDTLLERAARVNDKRLVWTPQPLVTRRSDDVADHSRTVVQPALAAGTPVIVGGGVPAAAIDAGEPLADLSLRVVFTTGPEREPAAIGTRRSGYVATVTGRHDSELLLHLFQSMMQSSLAGVPPQRRRR